MKNYNDYMDNISVDAQLHNKIIERATKKSAPPSQNRAMVRFATVAASVLTLLLGVWIFPGLWDNQNNITGGQGAPSYPNSAVHPLHSRYPLVFNRTDSILSITPDRRVDFFHELTPDQFSAVFPTLDPLAFIATATYLSDGSLVSVSAFNEAAQTNIWLMEGPTILIMPDEPPEISYVHEVAVTVLMSSWGDSMYFQANFMLGGIPYHVDFTGSEEAGQWSISEIVHTLIAGGPADLSILEDPVIPELRNDELTLEEARIDPDFGAYLPTNIPDSFVSEHTFRFINQTENSLFAHWGRGVNSISWQITKVTELDLARIVSVDEREKYDMSLYSIPLADTVPRELWDFVFDPIFLAEDMSIDVIRARAFSAGRRDDPGYSINFRVLYGDILVNINANGLSPEQIWDMLAGLN